MYQSKRGFVLKEALEINSRQRRDRLHIIADILVIAISGSLKTQIMYKANLSFAQLNEYLSFLLEVKLIAASFQGKKTVYKATSKGTRFLHNYTKIKDLLKKEGEQKAESNPLIYTKDGNCYKTKE
jgi:predicted transcriptional regulator